MSKNDHSIVAGPNGKVEGAKIVDKRKEKNTVNFQLKHYLTMGGVGFIGGFLASLLANYITNLLNCNP